ncbi:hypothetical protein KORDIASMS9_02830 [Kordia sp. SMS9]|uniref:hypothetical protein n=1 Tax=Kordia sp. SMS9 TaxID=2282170 RepID=UPI000E102609|nr:hypothetical protein [Kordia sp. SMS9]AXG70590.1 hypothetical protein KORDIASMS9_02830 [Kordia sp. SMS9]
MSVLKKFKNNTLSFFSCKKTSNPLLENEKQIDDYLIKREKMIVKDPLSLENMQNTMDNLMIEEFKESYPDLVEEYIKLIEDRKKFSKVVDNYFK